MLHLQLYPIKFHKEKELHSLFLGEKSMPGVINHKAAICLTRTNHLQARLHNASRLFAGMLGFDVQFVINADIQWQ